jgi:SAM-dependent methyltransferase
VQWRHFGSLLIAGLLLGVGFCCAYHARLFAPGEEDSVPLQVLLGFGEMIYPWRWTAPVLLLCLALWVRVRRIGANLRRWHLATVLLLFTVFSSSSCLLLKLNMDSQASVLSVSRNFYGVLVVSELHRDEPSERSLVLRHGRITHGMQFTDPFFVDMPTTYYSERSGIGLLLRSLSDKGPMRVGVVGLGAGTLATYGLKGDSYRFYEINPEVLRLARERFTYLKRSKASISISLGDARLSLEREAPQAYDVLVLDAFSSDAIPVHLLTREAFALYLQHLAPGGVIAVHISNRFMDLKPVILKLKEHYKLQALRVNRSTDPQKRWDFGSDWILLSPVQTNLHEGEWSKKFVDIPNFKPDMPLWTDDYASLWPLLR